MTKPNLDVDRETMLDYLRTLVAFSTKALKHLVVIDENTAAVFPTVPSRSHRD